MEKNANKEAIVQNNAQANQNKAGEQPVAVVRAIDGVPKNLIVNYGDVIVMAEEDQVSAIRAYIRNKVLKQFGVTGINNTTVSQLPFGLGNNNVQTRLQLPKVKTDAKGVIAENIPGYYSRVLPNIKLWWQNSLKNSGITFEQVVGME